MHYNKGLIILDAFDLDIAAKCPFSATVANTIKDNKHCIRCSAFSKIAKYCFKRSFRGTNTASIKTLTNKYNHILLAEGVGEEECQTMFRKDIGILMEISYLSSIYQDNIAYVDPEVVLNFGQFSVRDRLDTILCIKGRYFITKFICDDHSIHNKNLLRYETIIGSLWIRETYSNVDENGVCFIQLSRTAEPLRKQADITPSTENLKKSIQSIIEYLQPKELIKSKLEYNEYKKKYLSELPVRFGSHCWTCQECFKF